MNLESCNKDKLYLIALSGGPDSMALLDMLYQEKYSLIVCFVNYHHRNNVDEEQEMVVNYVKKLNYKLEIKDCFYQEKNGNFENWARIERYMFFKEMLNKYHAEGCFVGHHQDDLIETYLLQKQRGYVSYYGLKHINVIKGVKIIRPLLAYKKIDLLNYCKNNNIPFSIDYTNDDINLKRNYLRKNIINNLNDNDRKDILIKIDLENQKIEQINQKIDTFINDNEINLDKINELNEEEFSRLIFKFVNNYIDLELSINRIKEIKNQLKKSGNVIIDLNNEYKLIKEYNKLSIINNLKYFYSIKVDKPSIVENEFIYFDLLTNPNKFYIKKDSYPLTIKIVEKNQKIKIGNIHKNINRLLIDEKIPYLKRLYWPMIVNNKNEIIFIPRKDFDEDNLFIVKTKKNMI